MVRIITPITSPSLTRGFLGGSDSAIASGASSTSCSSLAASGSASESASALTTKSRLSGAATERWKWHPIELDRDEIAENETWVLQEIAEQNPSFRGAHCLGILGIEHTAWKQEEWSEWNRSGEGKFGENVKRRGGRVPEEESWRPLIMEMELRKGENYRWRERDMAVLFVAGDDLLSIMKKPPSPSFGSNNIRVWIRVVRLEY